MNRSVILIILVGVLLRISVFAVSPPSNSYDDHLEAVAKNIVALQIPARVDPWECWECYQPPLYYWIASGVALLSSTIMDDYAAWKAVQSLSLLASCLTLLLTAVALFLVLPKQEHRPALYACIAVFAVLPRAIYSSAMTTNDALLELSVATALVGYILLVRRTNQDGFGLVMILVGTLAACWVKQSGLILLAPSLVLLFATITGWWNPSGSIKKGTVVSSLILMFFLAGLDEVWRFARTGIFMVSNQQYYNYAISQLPGSLSNISFLSLRGGPILENVFMEKQTLDSFWTELLARFWFDYERRFFPINTTAMVVGRIAYIFGAAVTFFGTIATINFVLRKPHNPEKMLLLFFSLAFLAVPILQTLRFPYYSSMKAVFVLPGVPAMLCLAGLGIAWGLQFRLIRLLTRISFVVALIFGCLHITVLVALSSEAWLYGLSGPLWPLPVLP